MVLDYYKLQEQPFGVTPDSRYLFSSPTHREALASLLYGIEAGCGFVALIAKPGLGKTTLLFQALDQLREKALTVFLFQTVCTPIDLLRGLLIGLGVQEIEGNLVQLQLRLKQVLLEQARLGKRVVAAIDEAQNLDDSVLELIRMLSNFETSREKLIQIILCGQPQLAEKIGSPDLEQLRQRVSIFARLNQFSPEDTQLYIDHRLRVAGYTLTAPLFTREALALICEYSEGIPRNINNLCFNALSLGAALQRKPIGSDTMREVIADLNLDRWRKKSLIAPLPPDSAAQDLPAFLSTASRPAPRGGWVPRIAVALVALLAIGGSIFEMHRRPVPKTTVRLNAAPPQLAQPAPVSSSLDQTREPLPTAAAGTVPTSANPSNTSQASADQAAQPKSSEAATLEAKNAPPGTAAPSNAGPSNGGSAQDLQQTDSTTEVRVMPGRTLLGICVEKFGSCNSELLQVIHRLNPRLSNLDHIEPGQSIRIPTAAVVSGASLVGQPGRTSIAEKESNE